MRRNIFLSFIFTILCVAGMAQCNPQSTANGSPCSQQTPATAFCADENPYGVTYPSSTNSPNSSPFTGNNQVDCCYTTPNPAWYYFQIDESGTLTIRPPHLVKSRYSSTCLPDHHQRRYSQGGYGYLL